MKLPLLISIALLTLASTVTGRADNASPPESGDPRKVQSTPTSTASPTASPSASPSPVAQLPPPATHAADACAQDILKTCNGMQWGEGMATCLKKNQASLSPACQTQVSNLAKRHNQFAAVRRTCHIDRTRLCGDVRPGQGRVLSCLKNNESKVSDVCRNELRQLSSDNQG